jgi:hypothetical protein
MRDETPRLNPKFPSILADSTPKQDRCLARLRQEQLQF